MIIYSDVKYILSVCNVCVQAAAMSRRLQSIQFLWKQAEDDGDLEAQILREASAKHMTSIYTNKVYIRKES